MTQLLAEAIRAEAEIPDADLQTAKGEDFSEGPVPKEKIESAERILTRAFDTAGCFKKVALAFSGGRDSMVLLDIVVTAGFKPICIGAIPQMQYPETAPFVKKTVEAYGLDLRIPRAAIHPLVHWRKTGWPMLGKQAARLWNQAHAEAGFKCNVSECCRTFKIGPCRQLTRNLGCTIQLTGQRGQQDDNLRGMRAVKDGQFFFQKTHKMWIANPLDGWTDEDVWRFHKINNLPEHPARERGARTIGCVFCGGGSQFTNSGYRILRKSWPEAWQTFMVDWRGGLIILALKYNRPIDQIQGAVNHLGGLRLLAEKRPWLFDFTRKCPRKGYQR